MFLFKTLAEAQLLRDQVKVSDAISVLEIEQETWRDVCKQMPNRVIPESGADLPQEITSAQATHVLGLTASPNKPSVGLSLDA